MLRQRITIRSIAVIAVILLLIVSAYVKSIRAIESDSGHTVARLFRDADLSTSFINPKIMAAYRKHEAEYGESQRVELKQMYTGPFLDHVQVRVTVSRGTRVFNEVFGVRHGKIISLTAELIVGKSESS